MLRVWGSRGGTIRKWYGLTLPCFYFIVLASGIKTSWASSCRELVARRRYLPNVESLEGRTLMARTPLGDIPDDAVVFLAGRLGSIVAGAGSSSRFYPFAVSVGSIRAVPL